VLAWVADLLALDDRPFRAELRLTYLNTSSIKCMMDLLDAMEEAHLAGRKVSLTWHYDPENDRALDLAEEFREDLSMPFHIVPAGTEG
jgi:sugar/nucleoside kinase (ribokinase family)